MAATHMLMFNKYTNKLTKQELTVASLGFLD